MKPLWSDSEVKGKDPLDQLVYRSRLLGRETGLCVWGGGNTSTKRTERDHLGRRIRVLWVKGSGSDLKASERKHFSPLRLDDLLPLARRSEMSDEEMVSLLSRSLVDPQAPRPSIEALLHAFIPFSDIDHSHADAILSVTNTKDGRRIARAIYGGRLLWIPYVKPGFLLAKRVFREYERNPQAEGAVLEKHGLLTWGNSSKESYTRMVQMVTRAERFAAHRARGRKPFGRPIQGSLSAVERGKWLETFLPVIRGAVSRRNRMILRVVRTPVVLEFVNSGKAPHVSQAGAATPDHMLRTKRVPLFVRTQNVLKLGARSIIRQIESYARAHERYFRRFCARGMQMLDPYPRIILVPGIGLIGTGKDMEAAIQSSEIYEHSIQTMRGAEAISNYRSLPLPLAFEMEYWPLELYKLSLAPPAKPLAGRVALITGAAGAIGWAITERLAKEGAHVSVCDVDFKRAAKLADSMNQKFGVGRAVSLRMDVTRETEVVRAFRETVLSFGGLDLVVSNAGIAHIASVDVLSLSDWERSLGVNATGHFLVAREAVRILKRQGLGGSLIFIATKNVLAPGKDFGAYSASKSAEAQLARICAIEGGEFGIRSNLVNPDGIFDGSGLWSRQIRQNRARSYGISASRLEDYYRNRNLLKTRVYPSDAANAVAFLASEESSKTSGCILTVDGGVREAFPR